MAKVPNITDANFSEAVGPSSGLVAVDFTAAWCPPCRIVGKLLEEFVHEYESKIEIRALDTDLNPATAARYGIRGLPTVVFFLDGEELGRVIGAGPRLAFRQYFDEALKTVASTRSAS
jgi:thioredoxin 1